MTTRTRKGTRAGSRPQATDDEIRTLRDEGLSQKQIATELNARGYQYTQQGIAYRLAKMGLQEEKERVLPWLVHAEHTNGWVYQAALSYAKMRQGRGTTQREISMSRSLEQKLTDMDAVLTYDGGQGFMIRDRRPSDGPGLLA